MNLLGKTTIHPFFFYTGKISGYVVCGLYLFSLWHIGLSSAQQIVELKLVANIVAVLGLLMTGWAWSYLGSAVRLGLPSEKTKLKTQGAYRFSRNPMYVGFNFITIAAMLYLGTLWVFFAGSYSLVIYHFIILGEEAFLKKRFGKPYLAYMKKTRRYF